MCSIFLVGLMGLTEVDGCGDRGICIVDNREADTAVRSPKDHIADVVCGLNLGAVGQRGWRLWGCQIAGQGKGENVTAVRRRNGEIAVGICRAVVGGAAIGWGGGNGDRWEDAGARGTGSYSTEKLAGDGPPLCKTNCVDRLVFAWQKLNGSRRVGETVLRDGHGVVAVGLPAEGRISGHRRFAFAAAVGSAAELDGGSRR